jgi:integrase
MTDDHHGRTVGRATLLVRAVDDVLGTHNWVPQEIRHTLVSRLSSNGTALADIADLVGHKDTATTETVYPKVIVPELRRGAEVMDRLFI